MEMNVLDEKRLVEIWLTRGEKNDPQLRAGLKQSYAEWKRKKYTVCVYVSGDGELYGNTRDLLAYNKRRLAVPEAQKEKPKSVTVG